MIDADRIDELVDLALPLPEASRLALLDGFTHCSLTPQAWRRAAPLVDTLRLSEQAEAYEVLARVPLLTVRTTLRSRAQRQADALGRRIALALARLHDDAAVQRLLADFRQRPDADVACALACVLQRQHGVAAEDLYPGLQSPDEMVRFWTAIAIARVLRRDGTGPDFEPLELLWDAFVRPIGVAGPPNPLLDGPPGLFWGDPAWAAGQIAVVRPLPPAALAFVLGLKDNDFDDWQPRRPESTADSGAVRALVAGLTGRYHADGTPVSAAEHESSPVVGGVSFEAELPTLIARAVAQPEVPGWATGNDLLDLAQSVSPETPLEIAPLLGNAELVRIVPREQIAWAIARIGQERVVDQFGRLLKAQPMREQIESIEWLRDIAREFGAPTPYMGEGGEAAPPEAPAELIDDLPRAAAAPPLVIPPPLVDSMPFEPSRPSPDPAADDSDATTMIDRGGTDSVAPPSVPGEGDEPPHEPEFHFVLTGDDALGDAVRAGAKASLEFRFDRPPPDALATVDSDALEQAREADRDIMLEATAYGSLSLPGTRHGVARFRQGALLAPVTFVLAAGTVDESGSGVHVEFIVRGETVHQIDLPIAVLGDADALRKRAQARRERPRIGLGLLDDAAGAAPPPPQRARLALAVDAQGFRIDLTHWIGDESKTYGPFVAPAIDRTRLETLVDSLRKDLEGCYRHPLWTRFAGVIDDGELGNLARAELPRACSTVAAVGARLNTALREDAPAIAQALDRIETLPEGSTLTIATDAVYLPWEILYPRRWLADFTDEQRKQFPLDPKLFWGARFAIETVQLRNSGSLVEQRKKHLAAGPKISVNLHPKIRVDGLPDAEQPAELQRVWATRRLSAELLEAVQDDCDAMRDVLQNANTHASLLYVYCHGSAARPFGGGDELLEVAKGCTITPAHLAGDKPFDGAPIVFLNACESAAHSPLAFSSFLKEFRRRGALGMIAASFAVPIVFGAHFGAEVAQCVLARRGSLAVALRQLRRRHLLEGGLAHGNPVPLFYALQCQITYPDGGGT